MKKVALLLLIALLVSGCHHGMLASVKGSGNRQSQKREIGPFTSISTEGDFTFEIVCQRDVSLEVEGDDNVLPMVKAEVHNNVLRLSTSGGYSAAEPVKFKISVPNIEEFRVSGAGRIDIKGINNDKFKIDADGAPVINVSGDTKLVDIHSNGAGTINTNSLNAARAIVNSNGATQVEVDANEQLDVIVNGPSTVTYKGDPVVNKKVNGPGSVEKRGSGAGA